MGQFSGSPHVPRAFAVPKERLDSWKEIAAYLDRDVSTVRRWERKKRLPVHRVPGGERDTIYAVRSEIDRWLAGQSIEPATASTLPKHCSPMGRLTMVAALCATLALPALWIWFAPAPDRFTFRITPLMTQPGRKLFPALSPDGRFVAFTWNGENQDNYDVYVKLLDSESPPVRITTDPALDMWPSWAPDSNHLLFARWRFGSPKAEYFIVPALGGPERKIVETFVPIHPPMLIPLAAWVRGGEAVIVSRALSPAAEFRLFYTRLDTFDAREFLPPRHDSPGDCCPTLSPDGRTLAFVRTGRDGIPNIHLATMNVARDGATAASPRQLTSEDGGAWNPAWTGGGKELLYLAGRDGTPALWRISVSGGDATFVRSMVSSDRMCRCPSSAEGWPTRPS